MLISDDCEWDHDTFEAYVEGMCEQIRRILHPRIAFLAYPKIETILTFFAIWKIGKIACPLNIRLPSTTAYVKKMDAFFFSPIMPNPQPPTPYSWNLDNLATFLFTSGSSGHPKIACHTLKNHIYSALGSNSMIPLNREDRWALSLPLFHIGAIAILFRSYLAKSFVLLSKNWESATHLSLVPTQLYRMIKDRSLLPRLKAILLGGGPSFLEYGPQWNIINSYGMTEMSSQIVTNHQLHPYAQLAFDPSGEILVRGDLLFKGYYHEGKIDLSLDSQGWFPTKDKGSWEGGMFSISGRKDHLFISGGENIQPEEIEEIIQLKSGVRQVVVVPYPDREFGARPVIFLEKPEQLGVIQKKLENELPKYKIPFRAFPFPEAYELKPDRDLLKKLAYQLGQDEVEKG